MLDAVEALAQARASLGSHPSQVSRKVAIAAGRSQRPLPVPGTAGRAGAFCFLPPHRDMLKPGRAMFH